MSFLYLKGLKQGDTQMTVFGIMLAGLFFLISQSKPMIKLSAQKPPSSVFENSVLFSIIGQCIIQITALYVTSLLCSRFKVDGLEVDTNESNPDEFSPNLINTAVFLVTSTIQVNNFTINYYGHPFMQALSENAMLYRSIGAIYVVLLVLAGGQIEPLNDLFQLIDFNRIKDICYLL